MNPINIDKYLYIRKTPTWKVRFLYLFGILSWLLILWGFRGAISLDPFYRWFVVPVLGILTIYHLTSFSLNLFYTQFDVDEHFRRVQAFWKIRVLTTTKEVVFWRPPSVDIFLPICGENIDILFNTWTHVVRLKYRNKKVYVLDDSATQCAEHRALAKQFGFTYIERPNKGEMKKAGNLKYAYERTNGEYIVGTSFFP